MSKWDGRNRGRPSLSPKQDAPRLSYVPIVRGSLRGDQEEWSELRRNGLAAQDVDAPWDPLSAREGEHEDAELPVPDGFDDEPHAEEPPPRRDAVAPAVRFSMPASPPARIAMPAAPLTLSTATPARMSIPAAAPRTQAFAAPPSTSAFAVLPKAPSGTEAARMSTPGTPSMSPSASAARAQLPRDTLDLANDFEEPVATASQASTAAPASTGAMSMEAARKLATSGDRDGAMVVLETLCTHDPNDATARLALVQLSLELGAAAKVREHVPALVAKLASMQQLAAVCKTYRAAREHMPSVELPEATLVLVLDSAHASNDSQVVVDATKQLVHRFPQSQHAARALATTAGHQIAVGRADLARQTLTYLIASYPNDPWAAAARRKLGETQ